MLLSYSWRWTHNITNAMMYEVNKKEVLTYPLQNLIFITEEFRVLIKLQMNLSVSDMKKGKLILFPNEKLNQF